MISTEISFWWTALCVVAVFNVVAWAVSANVLLRRQNGLPPDLYASRRLQVLLSAGYVFGCAFRSAFPVFDVPRLCLLDSWLSSVVVGRSVATVAEVCFAAQWALLLREIAITTASGIARRVSRVLLPLIAVAEICSWYSVVTTDNLGHVIEESLWGLSGALVVVSIIAFWPRCDLSLRRLLTICCASGIAYIAYMFVVDVPMYWSRWIADEASGRHYFDVAGGFIDISQRWTVSHRWDDWKNEIAWMSLYFSVAVWLSISLVHLPALRLQTAGRTGPRAAG